LACQERVAAVETRAGRWPYRVGMRWEALFRDLEAQAENDEHEHLRAQAAERTRGERATTVLAARIAATRGDVLAIELRDGSRVTGTVVDAGGEWVLLRDGMRERLVPLHASAAFEGLSRRSDMLSRVEGALPITSALRALSRDRARVQVRAGGSRTGVIGAVGRDHLDLSTDAGATVVIPIAAVYEVSSA